MRCSRQDGFAARVHRYRQRRIGLTIVSSIPIPHLPLTHACSLRRTGYTTADRVFPHVSTSTSLIPYFTLIFRLTFLLLASACAAAFIWSTLVVPETRGLSLEEIDVLFSSSMGQVDQRRRKQVRLSLPALAQTLIFLKAYDDVGLAKIVRDIVDGT